MRQYKDSIDYAQLIDRRSFMLGMITAFGECIAAEAKKCAFSPPFYPDDYYTLKTEAERIASELGVHLWLEENLDIDEESRVQWWVMYKFPEVLEEYQALREQGLNPAFEFKNYFDLLGYGIAFGENADKVKPKTRQEGETMGTVERVLFQPGDWPPPADSRSTE